MENFSSSSEFGGPGSHLPRWLLDGPPGDGARRKEEEEEELGSCVCRCPLLPSPEPRAPGGFLDRAASPRSPHGAPSRVVPGRPQRPSAMSGGTSFCFEPAPDRLGSVSPALCFGKQNSSFPGGLLTPDAEPPSPLPCPCHRCRGCSVPVILSCPPRSLPRFGWGEDGRRGRLSRAHLGPAAPANWRVRGVVHDNLRTLVERWQKAGAHGCTCETVILFPSTPLCRDHPPFCRPVTRDLKVFAQRLSVFLLS